MKVFLFSADWCRWCQYIKQEIAELEQRHNFSFAKKDMTADKDKEFFKEKFDLRCIPAVIIFNDGEETARWDADEEETLTDFIGRNLR